MQKTFKVKYSLLVNYKVKVCSGQLLEGNNIRGMCQHRLIAAIARIKKINTSSRNAALYFGNIVHRIILHRETSTDNKTSTLEIRI